MRKRGNSSGLRQKTKNLCKGKRKKIEEQRDPSQNIGEKYMKKFSKGKRKKTYTLRRLYSIRMSEHQTDHTNLKEF